MTHAWSEGSDHGLAWPGVCALIEGALPQDAATAVWHHPQAAAGVRGFVTALQEASGLDWWSLPNFAAAFAVADGWRVVVRGPWVARWSGGELSGAVVSMWAEALVPHADGPVELGEDSPTLLRPLVAGVVPACRLRVEDGPSASVSPSPNQPAAPVEPLAAPGVEDTPLVDVPASADEAVDAPTSGDELERQRPAEPQPHVETDPPGDPVLQDDAALQDEPEVPAVMPPEDAVHDDGMTLLPGDEPAPTSLPDAAHGPADSFEDDEDDGLAQPDDDIPADRADAAQAEPQPAPQASELEPPEGVVLQGRFARQYGDTMAVSVEEAAVREDAEMIDFVPGQASATPEANQGEGSDDVHEPAPPVFVGDHDGETMLASSTPIPAPAPVSDADRVDERSETSDGVPLVLAALCEHGHPNPPERPTCTVCGASVAGETVRVPRPSLGTLLLSDGRRVDLTAPVIVGRSPRAERFTGSLAPQLVPLPQSHVSGLHLEIQLEGWRAMAIDLRSTNGTYLRRDGEAPARLSERPEPLLVGDVLDLGHGVTIAVEALR